MEMLAHDAGSGGWDVAALCERVVVLDAGSVRFHGTVAELVEGARGRVWQADNPDPAAQLSWAAVTRTAAVGAQRNNDGWMRSTSAEKVAGWRSRGARQPRATCADLRSGSGRHRDVSRRRRGGAVRLVEGELGA